MLVLTLVARLTLPRHREGGVVQARRIAWEGARGVPTRHRVARADSFHYEDGGEGSTKNQGFRKPPGPSGRGSFMPGGVLITLLPVRSGGEKILKFSFLL